MSNCRRMEVDVYELRCPECAHCQPYDGLAAGVYNYSNETLFTENVPKGLYTSVSKQARTTKYGFHNAMKEVYERSSSTFVCPSTFNKAMVAYLSVVKTNYKDGMTCSICRCLPAKKQCVLFDGLWAGVQREKMRRPIKYPYTDIHRPNINVNKFRIVQEQKARELLKAYTKKEGLQPDQMKTLTAYLSATSMLQFFQYVRSFEAPNLLRCPPAFEDFIKALASNSNGLALVHREARVNFNANGASLCMLESWITHCTPNNPLSMEDKDEIRMHFPALSALLGTCSLEHIPVEFHAVMVSHVFCTEDAQGPKTKNSRSYVACIVNAAPNPQAVARSGEHGASVLGADGCRHNLLALRTQLPIQMRQAGSLRCRQTQRQSRRGPVHQK